MNVQLSPCVIIYIYRLFPFSHFLILFAIFANPIIQFILGVICIKTVDIQFTEAMIQSQE